MSENKGFLKTYLTPFVICETSWYKSIEKITITNPSKFEGLNSIPYKSFSSCNDNSPPSTSVDSLLNI